MFGKDHLFLGPVPSDEDCFDLQHPLAKKEVRIFKDMLQRKYPEADLRLKRCDHEFGTYYEVCVFFDPDDEKETNLAYQIESEYPERWDEEALIELNKLKESLNV